MLLEEVNGLFFYTLIALHSKEHLVMSVSRKMAALQTSAVQMYIYTLGQWFAMDRIALL